jgi:Putative DnaT-like ssDNA binding protein
MPVILDATPGGVASNSFATLDQANAYFAGMLYADDWTAADVDTQTRALITSTLLIGASVEWLGWPTSSTQALPMPRSGLRTRNGAAIPSTVIPVELANATAEYARQLITAGAMPTAPSDTAGLKRLKAGPVELEWDGSLVAGSDGSLPIDVYALIAFLVVSGMRGRTCVPLERV